MTHNSIGMIIKSTQLIIKKDSRSYLLIYIHTFNLDYPLPGVEGFQIDGNPRPGFTLTACCFPTKGATLGIFQVSSVLTLDCDSFL